MRSSREPVTDSGSYRSSKALFIALLILLVWLPFPLGSARPWAWALMEGATMLLLAAFLITRFRSSRIFPEIIYKVRWPLYLLGLWLLYFLIQIVPLPMSLLEIISPSAYALYSYTSIGEVRSAAPLSLDVNATLVQFLKSLAYVVLFVLVLCLTDSQKRLIMLATVLFYVGLVQAVYGIFSHFSFGMLWDPSPSHLGVAGTYGNPNHFAGLMEMTIPIGIGLLFTKMMTKSYHPDWRTRLKSLASAGLDRKNSIYIFIIIMVGALFFSAARGGNIAFFSALFCILFIGIFRKGRQSHEWRLLLWVVVFAVIAILWMGFGGLQEKLIRSGLYIDRIPVWQDTLGLLNDYWLFGAGAGTFEWLFPMYRENYTGSAFFDHTHNDYLQMLANQGVVGFSLLMIPLVLLFVKILKGYLIRRDHAMRGIMFAALVGCLSMLIHSTIEFNMQIPANAAYFYVLLAMGIAATNLKYRKTRSRRRSTVRESRELERSALPDF